MKIIAAIACLVLALFNGWIYHKLHTDTSFVVANLYIIAGIILASGAKK